MDDKQHMAIMTATIKPVINLLQKRLNLRVEALNALQSTAVDAVPEKIQAMREEEAAKIRAVMQEQKDLLEILKAMYPDA